MVTRLLAKVVRGAALLSLAIAVACGSLTGGDEPETSPAPDGGADAPPTADAATGADASDAALPPCRLDQPFATPVLVDGLATTFGEKKARFTQDELTVYFTSRSINGQGEDIFTATRTSLGAPFGAAQVVPVVSTTDNESDLALSADGTMAVFGSDRANGQGQHDLWFSLRNAAGFGLATDLTEANDPADEGNPFLAPDGLWFTSNRGGGIYSIWRAPPSGGTFGKALEVTELRGGNGDFAPVLTADGLTIYFGSRRQGFGSNDVWTAHRTTLTDPFPNPAIVAEVNSSVVDTPSWISPDGCRLYLESARDDDAGTKTHVYVAARPSN